MVEKTKKEYISFDNCVVCAIFATTNKYLAKMAKAIYHIFFGMATFMFLMACQEQKGMEEKLNIGTSTRFDGDSTLYGLACDGCTDSILVFLPGQGGDPVTYNIIEAMKKRHIIGSTTVGSWTAVMVNPQDTSRADLVINLDELKGTWVNMVMPKRRNQSVSDSIDFADADEEMRAKIDSAMQQFMKPVEMGIALKRHYKAETIGLRHAYIHNQDPDCPVTYPTPKRYSSWHIFNGRLVLTEMADTTHAHASENKNDTAEIIMLSPDTLVLRFKNGERGYHRK